MRSPNHKKMPVKSLAATIFEYVMSVFYLLFAYVLLFTNRFQNEFSQEIRIPLGALLGAYGIYRIYRAFKIRNMQKREDEKEN